MIKIYQNKTEKEFIEELTKLSELKKYDQVIRLSKKLVSQYPKNYIFYNLLSYSLINKKLYKEAQFYLEKAYSLDEKNFLVLSNLGNVNGLLKNYDNAEVFYKKSLAIKPGFLLAIRNLANLKINTKRYSEAIKLLESNLKYHGKNYYLHFLLAKCYLHKGDFKNSNLYFKKTLLLNPRYTNADYSLSMATKYDQNSPHLKSLEAKIKDKKFNDYEKMYLYFSLGKAYDDISNFENSFTNFKKGNDICDKKFNYNVSNDREILSYIDKKINLQLSEIDFNEFSHKKIIFIVGMPRSGTTLAEQVLSSHKFVESASELPFLTEAIYKEIFSMNLHENVSKNNPVNKNLLNSIKDYYLDNINKINETTNYIIDKDPLNFKWISFINKIFPKAIIIHCSRNPIATCWSNYKLLNNNKSLGYSYNLNNLSNFYNIYMNYMNIWFKQFPNKIYNLEYEKFVTNFIDESKNLLSFCGLEWDENCLNFYKNNEFITTNPYDARQPVYSSSISSWKNYSKHLNSLINSIDIKK